MRGLSISALLLAPALARAVGSSQERVTSVPVSLLSYPLVAGLDRGLTFKLEVNAVDEACGYPDLAINGRTLTDEGYGEFTLDNDTAIVARWEPECIPGEDEQAMVLMVESVNGAPLATVGYTLRLRFRQTVPVRFVGVGVEVNVLPVREEDVVGIAREDLEDELDDDLAELEFLRLQLAELEREIESKRQFLSEMAEGGQDDKPECSGLLCFVKHIFDKVIGLAHPGRGKGHCGNHTRGNRTHGNHTFPHPPWRHPHGNHTHGNHSFPHPPWWPPHRGGHGNRTHGNHTFPRPPWRRPHRLPLCRPPPHHPPGEKPPHHGKPPHGEPPHHGKAPAPEPPAEVESPSQRPLSGVPSVDVENPSPRAPDNKPPTFFGNHNPLLKLAVAASLLFVLLSIHIRRCCSPSARAARSAWREERRRRRAVFRMRCRALVSRWFSFGPRSRGVCEEAWREEEKEAILPQWNEKVDVVEEKAGMEYDAEEEDGEGDDLSLSGELASFRAVADIVGQMVAVEEGRCRAAHQSRETGEGGDEPPPAY